MKETFSIEPWDDIATQMQRIQGEVLVFWGSQNIKSIYHTRAVDIYIMVAQPFNGFD